MFKKNKTNNYNMKKNKTSIRKIEFIRAVPTATLNRVSEPKYSAFGNMKPITLMPSVADKSLRVINSQNTISKKKMNWLQAKTKYPKLNPFGDADRDRVINMLDCKPFDKNLQDPKRPAKNINKDITPRPLTRKKKDIIAYTKQREAQMKKEKPEAKPFQFVVEDEGKKIKDKGIGGLVSPKSKVTPEEIARLESALNRKRQIEDIEEEIEKIKERQNLTKIYMGAALETKNKMVAKQQDLLRRQAILEQKVNRREQRPSIIQPIREIKKLKAGLKGLKSELGQERQLTKSEKSQLSRLEIERQKTLRKAIGFRAIPPKVIKPRKERITMPSEILKGIKSTEPYYEKFRTVVYPGAPEVIKEKREKIKKEEDEFRKKMAYSEFREGQIVGRPKTVYQKVKETFIKPEPKFSRKDYKELYQGGKLVTPILIETPNVQDIINEIEKKERKEYIKQEKKPIAIKYETPRGYKYFHGYSVEPVEAEEEKEKAMKEKEAKFEKEFSPYEKVIKVKPVGEEGYDYYETKERKMNIEPIEKMIDVIEEEHKANEKEIQMEIRREAKEAKAIEREERKKAKEEDKERKEEKEFLKEVETKAAKEEKAMAEVKNIIESPKESLSAQELIDEAK